MSRLSEYGEVQSELAEDVFEDSKDSEGDYTLEQIDPLRK